MRRSSVDEKRTRCSSEPPQPSVRRLDHGVQNWSMTAWYAANSSTPSKPACCARTAARTKPSSSSSISPSVMAWLPSASWYEGSPDGDQLGAKELSASPCWPTWYSCWIIVTSAASWQASVTRRKSGMSESSSTRKLPRVSTPVAWVGTGSTTIIAAPPSARSR